jgi:hypothetical protein
MTPFSSMRSISIPYRREAVSQHLEPWSRGVVGKLVRDRWSKARFEFQRATSDSTPKHDPKPPQTVTKGLKLTSVMEPVLLNANVE